MGEVGSWRASKAFRASGARKRRIVVPGLANLLMMAATAVLLSIATVLAIVFAATLAIVMTVATALLGIAALAWRVRRQPQPARIEARRVGHSWVAYRWDGR